MSVKSKPSTEVHADASKISDTESSGEGPSFAIAPCWPIGYRSPMPHADVDGQRIHFEDSGDDGPPTANLTNPHPVNDAILAFLSGLPD